MATHTFTLNGKQISVEAEGNVRLLWVLRDLLGVTGPKYGCALEVCKSCTSHINGKAFNPCSVQVKDIEPDDGGFAVPAAPSAPAAASPVSVGISDAEAERLKAQLLAMVRGTSTPAASIRDADTAALHAIVAKGKARALRQW